MKTTQQNGTSNGHRAYIGTIDKLSKIYDDIAIAEAREWLFTQLQKENLTTRDIYFFALKQAQIRTENKTPDLQTVKFAMKAKQRDISAKLKALFSAKRKEQNVLLNELEGRRYKYKKILKRIRNSAESVKYEKIEAYETKIKHYRTNQIEINRLSPNKGAESQFANTALSLTDYNKLSIFRGPQHMPKPEAPLGPYICDSSIVLDENERKILSKTPKFSVRKKILKQDMMIELERCLNKHRFNMKTRKGPYNKKNGRKVNNPSPEKILLETGDRLKTLAKLWENNSGRLVYNELTGSVNFTQRRPTDYRHNKGVKLPGPLDPDGEFSCELRRRKFMKAFNTFDKDTVGEVETQKELVQSKEKLNKPRTTQMPESNLTKREQAGLKSLKKRMKAGELIVGQTDKSSRFCILNKDQYLRSGLAHTKNDEEILWPQVKTLQNRVNSVVWWLSKSLNHSIDTDEQRMLANIQDHNSEVAEMYLLFKDHKQWSQESGKEVPSRPVVSGNKTYNVHLSELLSEILEPVAKESQSAEISSTEDALCQINNINQLVQDGTDLDTVDALTLSNKKYSFRSEVGEAESQKNIEPPVLINDTNLSQDISETDSSLIELLCSLANEDNTVVAGSDHNTGTTTTETISGAQDATEEEKGPGPENDWSRLQTEKKSSAQTDIRQFCKRVESKMEIMEAENMRGHKNAVEYFTKEASKKKIFTDILECQFKASNNWDIMQSKEVDKLITEGEKRKVITNDPVQDTNLPHVMVGGDVVALYPSMEANSTAAVAYRAVKESKLKFEKINYAYAMVFLTLTLGVGTIDKLGLAAVMPTRCVNYIASEKEEENGGFKYIPHEGGNPRSLNAKINRDLNAWKFDPTNLTDQLKREILARTVQVATLVLMTTHCYCFGGRLYRQLKGAPIGLRASACLAKVLMSHWDGTWAKVQKSFGLSVQLFYRYVDDIRIYLRPIDPRWIWTTNGWTNVQGGEKVGAIEHTKNMLKESFEQIFDCLKFTTESQDDYVNNMLPTLDFKTETFQNGNINFEQIANLWPANPTKMEQFVCRDLPQTVLA